MKKLIIGFSCLLGLVFTIHLFSDDELNPQAQKWLNYYSQAPNLDKNAHIELISLGIEGVNAYELAKQKYLASVSQVAVSQRGKSQEGKGLIDHNTRLKYPSISDLPDIRDDPKYCSFEEPGCFKQLEENKPLILKDINLLEDRLLRFRALAFYDNFDFLNSNAIEATLDLLPLYQLSGIQAYYLINDGEMDKAASLIANLMLLERQFLKTSSDAMFLISPVVNYQIIYQPLIEALYTRGFNHWEDILLALKALDSKEVSMNNILLNLFAYNAKTLKLASSAQSLANQKGFYMRYLMRLIYKENMTLNDLFSDTQALLIDENLGKDALLEEIKLVEHTSELAYAQLTKDTDSLIWTSIKNYRNVIGTQLRLQMTKGELLSFNKDLIFMDLRILLLNGLIQSQDKCIQDIVNLPQFINPYTGKHLSLDENKICYYLEEPICVNRAPTTMCAK